MGTAAIPQIIKTNGTKIPSPSTPTVNANRIAIPRNAAGMRKSFFHSIGCPFSLSIQKLKDSLLRPELLSQLIQRP